MNYALLDIGRLQVDIAAVN